jgi:hypothetical protein
MIHEINEGDILMIRLSKPSNVKLQTVVEIDRESGYATVKDSGEIYSDGLSIGETS